MSILDDAIREHLELKRQHGADDAELKKLEDEAFGPPARPESEFDPFAEAPTEFLVAPGAEGDEGDETGEADLGGEEPAGGRRINVADLQEPPLPAEAEALEDEVPAEEDHPAMEHEAVTDLPADDEAGHSTEERHAIAEQPTEMFDVEGELAAALEADSPSDEQLFDAELNEPRLAPVDPIEGIEASAAADAPPSDEEIEEHADEFDEFFSEQRLSDELNQALEAPLEDEPAFPPTEEAEVPHRNFAEEESGEVEDERPTVDDDAEPEDDGEQEQDHPAAHHGPDHQDALEDTPEFLADDPEDENLWFEQKPPKDIDFGD
ncbi:MAG: hypothetical protein ABW065_02885 [Solirubrobacterales bacterium]